MEGKNYSVGMAEYKVSGAPDTLSAFGLGSCVGVTLWDPKRKFGGLAHIMLPSSKAFSNSHYPGKYADTAIDSILGELKLRGCDPQDLEAKLVGGANMFPGLTKQSFPVGLRNVVAARQKLSEAGVPIVAEAVGGQKGRTIVFSLGTGRLGISQFQAEAVEI